MASEPCRQVLYQARRLAGRTRSRSFAAGCARHAPRSHGAAGGRLAAAGAAARAAAGLRRADRPGRHAGPGAHPLRRRPDPARAAGVGRRGRGAGSLLARTGAAGPFSVPHPAHDRLRGRAGLAGRDRGCGCASPRACATGAAASWPPTWPGRSRPRRSRWRACPARTTPRRCELRPTISLSANVALDPASLAAHARLRVHGEPGEGIALDRAARHAPAQRLAERRADADRAERGVRSRAARLALRARPGGGAASAASATTSRSSRACCRATATCPASAASAAASPPTTRCASSRVERGTPGDALRRRRPAPGRSRPRSTRRRWARWRCSPAPPRGATVFAAADDRGRHQRRAARARHRLHGDASGADLRDTFGQRLGSARDGDLPHRRPARRRLGAQRHQPLPGRARRAPERRRGQRAARRAGDLPRAAAGRRGALSRSGSASPTAATCCRRRRRGRASTAGARAQRRAHDRGAAARAKLGAPAGALAYGVAAHLGHERDFVASRRGAAHRPGRVRAVVPRRRPGQRAAHRRRQRRSPARRSRSIPRKPTPSTSRRRSRARAPAPRPTACARFAGAGLRRVRGARRRREPGAGLRHRRAQGRRLDLRAHAASPAARTPATSSTAGRRRRRCRAGRSSPTASSTSPARRAQMTAAGWFLVDGVLRRGSAPSYALTLEAPGGQQDGAGPARARRVRPGDVPGRAAQGARRWATTPCAPAPATASRSWATSGWRSSSRPTSRSTSRSTATSRRAAARSPPRAASAYLFGAPLGGAATKFTVTRSPADFTPKGRDAFAFGRRWFWPQEPPDAATDVLETTDDRRRAGQERGQRAGRQPTCRTR